MTEIFHVWTTVVATGRCALARSRRNTHLKPGNFTERRSDVWKPDLPRAPGSRSFLSIGRRPGSLGLCCSQHLSPLPQYTDDLGAGLCLCLSRDIIPTFLFPCRSSRSCLDAVQGAGVWYPSRAAPGVSCQNDVAQHLGGWAPAGLGIFRAAWKPPSPEAREVHPPAFGPPRGLPGIGGCWEDFPAGKGSSFFQGCSLFSEPDCLNTLKKVLPKPTVILKGLFQRHVYRRCTDVKRSPTGHA